MLREILTATGDIPPKRTAKDFSWYNKEKQAIEANIVTEFYDSQLVEAVKSFQARHALNADGIIGPASRAALNTPTLDRLAQLYIARDKMREFVVAHPDFKLGILVNIPSYKLQMLEGGKVVEQMRTIVGKRKRETPTFSNQITYLEFNPKWYVPKSIATKDLLPKIQEDPTFVSRAGFELKQEGELVDATTIDWSVYNEEDFPFRLTQGSGRSNALGKVKFMLPNNRAIYLHDTSKHYLFKRDYRALSSGCVRVEDPLKMTQYVLGHGHNTPPEMAAETYQSERRKGIQLETPIDVHTVYWTAWVEPEATLPSFANDIYRIERGLVAEKKKELEAKLRVVVQ